VIVTRLQRQARALGDPTRHGIFRYIADSDRPADIAEMTAHFGLNHNAIRQHLAKLLEAALVVEGSVRGGGPGRPRLVYEVHPAADGRWGAAGPYERLSLLLVETLRTGDTPVQVGIRAAERFRATATNVDDAETTVSETMARLGFEPTVRRRGNGVDIVLGTCPFAAAAVADPDTVCSLHFGLAQGLAEGSDMVAEELVAKDPRRAQCRLRLRHEAVTG
jgi:predicted ArsR family transcriptional regulator